MTDAYQIDLNKMVEFTRRLVQTPSESGREKEVAEIIAAKMRQLGYDEVFVDELYNVVGRIKGEGGGNSLLLLSHIDHAEPGVMEEPYSGKLMDGSRFGTEGEVIYGRAAVDMKGAVACMVYAAAAIKKAGLRLKGDVIVAGNSREEQSAAEGVLYMLDADKITADMAICGEATNLNVYLGHRGNAEVKMTVKGRMSHGSNPNRGINAITKAAEFINFYFKNYTLPRHELLGDCTTTVLDIEAETERSAPVVPDRCNVWFDRRFLPGETKEQIIAEYLDLIERAKAEIADFEAEAEITKWGLALYTPKQEKVVQGLLKARAKVMGDEGKPAAWIFGTDGAFTAAKGIPTVGFGPGDEAFAHTPADHIPVSHLDAAARVYAQAIIEVCS